MSVPLESPALLDTPENLVERDFQHHLATNLHKVFIDGKILRLVPDGVFSDGEEYPMGGKFCDLLAQAEDGTFYPIEIKYKTHQKYEVAGQIGYYMGWTQENLAGSAPVRGVLVLNAGSVNDEIRLSAKANPDLIVLIYEKDIAPHIGIPESYSSLPRACEEAPPFSELQIEPEVESEPTCIPLKSPPAMIFLPKLSLTEERDEFWSQIQKRQENQTKEDGELSEILRRASTEIREMFAAGTPWKLRTFPDFFRKPIQPEEISSYKPDRRDPGSSDVYRESDIETALGMAFETFLKESMQKGLYTIPSYIAGNDWGPIFSRTLPTWGYKNQRKLYWIKTRGEWIDRPPSTRHEGYWHRGALLETFSNLLSNDRYARSMRRWFAFERIRNGVNTAIANLLEAGLLEDWKIRSTEEQAA